MGKNTYLSIKHPLKNRTNIVVSHSNSSNNDNLFFTSFDKVSELIKNKEKNCFVIGGTQIYKLFEDKITTVYLTLIEKEFNCDCKFINDLSQFKLVEYSN